MTGREMRQLERDLQSDLVDTDIAVRRRVREAVKAFLLDEAGNIASSRAARDEKEILELIGLHAKVELLRVLIEDPKRIAPKDMKELLKPGGGADLSKPIDAGAFIASLDVPDDQKAQLVMAAMQQMKRKLTGGPGAA